MTSLNQQELSGQAIRGRSRPRRWGLAALCAMWLVLLSPKVIFGTPDANDGRHPVQTVQTASTPAPDSVVEFSAGSPVAGALQISPAQIDVAVGRKLSFHLTDQQGHPIKDATWMVSDFTVADLDSLDPPRIAAITPGQVTVTAILGDQTVQAKINVVNAP
ncbi:MAG TPA: Ig-like domain-containing protein [Candidatus Acidoferrales bacterium]|nr:Ig-like domain-containing protein [Candidatus Acidoferrales bacterium]